MVGGSMGSYETSTEKGPLLTVLSGNVVLQVSIEEGVQPFHKLCCYPNSWYFFFRGEKNSSCLRPPKCLYQHVVCF